MTDQTQTPEAPPGGSDSSPPVEGPDAAKATVHPYAREGWRDKFIKALSVMPNVQAACESAVVSRGHAYRVRSEDPEFAEQWQVAIEEAVDRLERAAWTRAVLGVERVTEHYGKPDEKGNQVVIRRVVEVQFSDRMAELLLKAHRPEKYRERFDLHHHGEDDDVDQEIKQAVAEFEAAIEKGLPPGDIIEAEVVEPAAEPDGGQPS